MNRLIAILLLSAVSAGAGDLRVGTAIVRITPPHGAPMAGYYSDRAAEGTHDDLFAKALVLEKDGTRAALVVCDLLTLPRSVVEEARTIIESDSGPKVEHVMISATHAHTGPVIANQKSARETAQAGASDIAQKYRDELPAKIAQSVKLAAGNLRESRAFSGTGHEDHLSFNRRFFMKDGTVGWNPGKLNPNIVRVAGPIDPSVPVIYFETTNATPLAAYVNFAMHLDTVGGLQYSADYPFTLATILGKVKGPGMMTVFSTGTCGDINHVDVSTRDPQKGDSEAARIGTILAGEVLKTFARMKPVSPGPLRVKRAMVKLPLPEITPEDIEKARAFAVRYGTKNEPKFLEKVWAFKVLDVMARAGQPQEVEVQVIALGDDVAWVSLPGEIFVELGLAIKKASPFSTTILTELANGSIGYIPTRRAFAEGNYEPISARCAAGSGEMLVETATRLLTELHDNKPAQ